MLSISNVGARQAASYYTKDGYYVRRDGEDNYWQGQLQKELGLAAAIDPGQFDLIIKDREERAGYDLCFSAPKSVSVAMCLDEETRRIMIEAHEEAVASTLAKIEEREIGARVTKDGKTEHIKTGNMLCGKFNHYVSRNSDPQLHTHAVIMNQTKYEGKMYAVDNQDLYKNKIYYGQVYRNKLAAELMKRGYELTVTNAEKGFFELKDVDPAVLEQFSSRRQEILSQLKEWGQYTPETAAKAAVTTRQSKEHKDMNLLMQSWKETVDEIGGMTIQRAAEPISISAEEAKAQYEKAIRHLEQRNFAVTEKKMRQSILAAGVALGLSETGAAQMMRNDENIIELGAKLEKDAWDKPITDNQKKMIEMLGGAKIEKIDELSKGEASILIQNLGGAESYKEATWTLKENYVTTRANIETEQAIFSEVARTRGTMKGIPLEAVEKTLERFAEKEAIAAKQENRDIRAMTAEQRQAVLGITTSNNQYFVVQGLAGTGKTFMLDYARQVLEAEGYVVKGACFTGKAADGLQNDAKIPSVTLHSHLNTLEKEAGNRKPDEDMQNKTSWNFAGLQKGAAKEIWVVDEASMVDNKSMKSLMDAAHAKEAKVVFVGDDKQLLPVGVGNAFGNMVQTGKIDTVTIQDIRRQKDTTLLQSVREAVKGDINKSFELIAKDIKEISKPKLRLREIVKDYTSLTPKEQKETVVLTASNKDRRSLNDQIREALKQENVLKEGVQYQVEDQNGKKWNKEFSVGDKVIFLQNDNQIGVKNGQTGTIEEVKEKIMVIQSAGKRVEIDTEQYKKVDHGYAMTGHKAQGITVDRALINLDSSQAKMNTRNAFYVDISRARYDVTIYTDSKDKIKGQVKDFAQKLTSDDFKKVTLPPKEKTMQAVRKNTSFFRNEVNKLLKKTEKLKETIKHKLKGDEMKRNGMSL